MSEINLALPGNPRYQPKELQEIFGYDRLYHTVAEVEIANLEVLADIGVIPKKDMKALTPETMGKVLAITTTMVDRTERAVTKHDIRAWVLEAQKILGERIGRWLHLILTSYDVIDTGRVLQFIRAHELVLKPALKEDILLFAGFVRRNADKLQIGRSHGQHALPITVGFWVATILSRVLHNAKEMWQGTQNLVGKISGAVGAHNAQIGLGIADKCGGRSYERRVLHKLGVTAARISTQILPPEPMAYFLFSCFMQSASLGQFGRDCRHLMRSEIEELAEPFEENQVGSSTMAQKRNPVTFEGIEGDYWKNVGEFTKVMVTLISEHQRDLVASRVVRDFPTILVNLMTQLNALRQRGGRNNLPFLERIQIDPEACARNFSKSAKLILAEPMYIALQMAGYKGDAHHLVNHTFVPEAKRTSQSLLDVAMKHKDSKVIEALQAIPPDLLLLLGHPERYVGDAKEQALEIASGAEQFASQM